MPSPGIGQKLTYASNAIWIGRIGLPFFGVHRAVEQIDILRHGGSGDVVLISLFFALALCGAFLSASRVWTAFLATALLAMSLTILFLQSSLSELSYLSFGMLFFGIAGIVAVFTKRRLLEEREAARSNGSAPIA